MRRTRCWAWGNTVDSSDRAAGGPPGFSLNDFIELERDCERRVTRLIERNVERRRDLLNRLQELHAERNKIRSILRRSEEQWPLWQTGLQSASRHEFLMGVLAEISMVVFADDDTPEES
jgi:midasin (ATPase involved in ribosome maturation)